MLKPFSSPRRICRGWHHTLAAAGTCMRQALAVCLTKKLLHPSSAFSSMLLDINFTIYAPAAAVTLAKGIESALLTSPVHEMQLAEVHATGMHCDILLVLVI